MADNLIPVTIAEISAGANGEYVRLWIHPANA